MKINVFHTAEYLSKGLCIRLYNKRGAKEIWNRRLRHIELYSYDKFSFEFAGYADKPKTIKLWMIRRTDGKYLTAGMEYKDKLTGSAASAAKFLLASLGNGQYKILLPKLPVCNIAAIWDDIDVGYNIANFDYDDPRLDCQRH
jgi:hypothetical protein